jgi:hypothetical protein
MRDKVKAIYEEVQKGIAQLFIPSIVLDEIAYLSEKERNDTTISLVELREKHLEVDSSQHS